MPSPHNFKDLFGFTVVCVYRARNVFHFDTTIQNQSSFFQLVI